MRVRDELRWWGLGAVLLVVFLWLFSGAMLPFVLGAAIAYLLDPLADRLEARGLSRVLAVTVITVVAAGLVVCAALVLIPILVDQSRNAIEQAPAYFDELRRLLYRVLPLNSDGISSAEEAMKQLGEKGQGITSSILHSLWSGGLALVDFISLLVVTPVVAFYLLLDWDRLVAWIDDALPRDHRDTIRALMTELDSVLAGFVRGQLSVCFILGAFYAIALTLTGLNFGLLIGAVAGFISFIPFVGSIVGGVLSLGVATAQFWEQPWMIGIVAAIFAGGQTVEGNFLTPRFIGKRIGLHPVWLIFALTAFGTLFGPVGLFVAVPVSAAIGVFGRFLLRRYKAGPLYKGTLRHDDDRLATDPEYAPPPPPKVPAVVDDEAEAAPGEQKP